MIEWRVSDENTLMVSGNSIESTEFEAENAEDFGLMEQLEVEDWLREIYGDREFRMIG